jgi:N-acetyl-anhydromuramyl-L-alanine amidase AmpD
MKSIAILLWFLLFWCPLAQAQKTQDKGFLASNHPQYYCVTIREFQTALTKKGYPVKPTNIWDKKTQKAFMKFVMDKGLPTGNVWGYFSEAFPALGIEPCLK